MIKRTFIVTENSTLIPILTLIAKTTKLSALSAVKMRLELNMLLKELNVSLNAKIPNPKEVIGFGFPKLMLLKVE